MPDLLTVHAMTRGDKLALVEEPGGRTRTFLELNSRVNRLANGLRKLGVQAGERISGMSYNSIEGSEAAHAARKAGAVATPINYHLKPAEAAYVINDSGARILFVGLNTPKQDLWMAQHRDRVRAVMLGVGAAFDFVAGTKPQAPRWMMGIGLEWLFRLATEPRRLWKRYLKHNPRFVVFFAMQLLGFNRYKVEARNAI